MGAFDMETPQNVFLFTKLSFFPFSSTELLEGNFENEFRLDLTKLNNNFDIIFKYFVLFKRHFIMLSDFEILMTDLN